MLAVGLSSGELALFSVENGDQLSQERVVAAPSDDSAPCAITTLSWTDSDARPAPVVDLSAILPAAESVPSAAAASSLPLSLSHLGLSEYTDRSQRFFHGYLPIPKVVRFGFHQPAPSSTIRTVRKPPEGPLSVVCGGDSLGRVFVRAFGGFELCLFNLCDLVGSDSPLYVLETSMSPDLRSLSVLYTDAMTVRWVRFRTPVLFSRRRELRLVAAQSLHIDYLVSYLQQCFAVVGQQWTTGQRIIQRKFVGLESTLEDFWSTGSPLEELGRLLVSGVPSDGMLQFLGTMASQALDRNARAIDDSCAKVMETLRDNIAPVVEELLFRLSELRGLARWEERFAPIGVTMKWMSRLCSLAEALLLRVDELHRRVHTAKRNYEQFFLWFSATVLRLVDESDGDPPPMPRTDTKSIEQCIRESVLADVIAPEFDDSPAEPVVSERSTDPLDQLWGEEMQAATLGQLAAKLNALWVEFKAAPSEALNAVTAHAEDITLCQLPADIIKRCPDVPALLPSNDTERTHANLVAGRLVASRFVASQSAHMVAFVSNQSTLVVMRCRLDELGAQHEELGLAAGDSASSSYACMALPAGVQVRGLSFYDDSFLSVLLLNEEDRRSRLVHVDYTTDELEFANFAAEDLDGVALADAGLVDAEDMVIDKQRVIPRVAGWALAVTGSRGVGCVVAGKNRVMLFDLAEDEEEDDDEDDDEDEEEDDD